MTVLFKPTWYKEFKTLQEIEIKWALFEGREGLPDGMDWQCFLKVKKSQKNFSCLLEKGVESKKDTLYAK